VVGLPEGKQSAAASFKAQFASGSGPWAAKAVNVIDTLLPDPSVSAIQQIDPALILPCLNDNGVLLSEIEGNLLEVKEMDELYSHGFQSSFMQHHLASNPSVSAIPTVIDDPTLSTRDTCNNDMPSDHIANLPTDGPEVAFISRVNRTDTVVAHVDTGANGHGL
jgi:hypothetical protein